MCWINKLEVANEGLATAGAALWYEACMTENCIAFVELRCHNLHTACTAHVYLVLAVANFSELLAAVQARLVGH